MLRSSATHYYSADGLGSVTSLTNGSGAGAASYTYDTFGNLAASSGSLVNPFRYTAREWDAETGLYFYRARYYDPGTGRFLAEDLLRFSGGVNLYLYVRNSPTGLVDPSGLTFICPVTDPMCRQDITKHLSDCAKEILKPYFPDINLEAVELVSALPGWANMAPIDVGAITLENTIYYKPGSLSGDATGLAAIAHELVHVQQQSSGLFPFLRRYVRDYTRNLLQGDDPEEAYERIPAEDRARAVFRRVFDDLFRKYRFEDICKTFCQ